MSEKLLHLVSANLDGSSECGISERQRPDVTVDIDKVTCNKCRESIEL